MGRKKGALNKDKVPAICALTSDQRIQIIAGLLLDIITGELCVKS
jgi:hypothetical protein